MTLFDDPPTIDPPLTIEPQSELEIRDEILEDLERRNAVVLDWLRKQLVVIYRFRCEDVTTANAYVCADDAREIIDNDPRFNWFNRNALGSLFRSGGWQATGYTKSQTSGSHANRLTTWRYVG